MNPACLYLGITFPSGAIQKRLLEQVYREAGVDPVQVAYVEAHGTGTKAGDPQEINSVVDVFCKDGRLAPLLIGSTKSNMGHPEPASGMSLYLLYCFAIYYFVVSAQYISSINIRFYNVQKLWLNILYLPCW